MIASQKQDDDDHQPVAAPSALPIALARSRTASASPSSTSLMSRTPARMPPEKSPRRNCGQDGVLDDERAHEVGDERLEPAPDLDPHLALVRRHDQQHAVVLARWPMPHLRPS